MRILLPIIIAVSFLLTACSGGKKNIHTSYQAGEEAFSQDKPSTAMKHYLSAYEESKRLGNDYWRAKSAERIADLFIKAYNYPEAVRYRTEAIEAYEKADSLIDKIRADHRLEAMTELDGRITGRMFLQDSLLASGYRQSNLDSILLDISGSKRMSPNAVILKMYGLDFLGDYLLEILPDWEKLEGAIYLGNFLRQQNEMNKSDSILIDARKYAASDEDRIKILYALYLNARSDGNSTKALALADSILRCQEAVTNRILMQTIDGAHSEYYAEASVRNQEKSGIYLLVSIVIIFIVVLAAFFIWRIQRLRLRAQRAELEANIEALVNMKTYSAMQTLRIDDLRRTHQHAEAKKEQVLASLFKEKWKTLNRLCEQYYESGDSQKMKESVARKIESEVKAIGSDDGLMEIQAQVDRYLDGIVTKLRHDFPSLKPKDIAFCTLLFAGFSTKAICFILDIQSGNFYVRKGRMIKKLNESDSPHKQEFLSRIRQ